MQDMIVRPMNHSNGVYLYVTEMPYGLTYSIEATPKWPRVQ